MLSDFVGAGSGDDGCMRPHAMIMHFALSECKRLLRHEWAYAPGMDTPNARLKAAREAAGFATAVEAAAALSMPASTYIGHENGHRGFPAKRAPIYARKFKVSAEWLLYGREGPYVPSEPELIEILAAVQAEIPTSTPFGEWPRVAASGLQSRLALLISDRSRTASQPGGRGSGPAKDAPPPPATN